MKGSSSHRSCHFILHLPFQGRQAYGNKIQYSRPVYFLSYPSFKRRSTIRSSASVHSNFSIMSPRQNDSRFHPLYTSCPSSSNPEPNHSSNSDTIDNVFLLNTRAFISQFTLKLRTVISFNQHLAIGIWIYRQGIQGIQLAGPMEQVFIHLAIIPSQTGV